MGVASYALLIERDLGRTMLQKPIGELYSQNLAFFTSLFALNVFSTNENFSESKHFVQKKLILRIV